MSGFNRFGGGMNMQNMLKQAQKMQADMERKKQELAETELVGVSGGGMVEVTISGTNEIKAVRIKPEAVDPDDVEMLEDLVLSAVRDAQNKAKELSNSSLGAFSLQVTIVTIYLLPLTSGKKVTGRCLPALVREGVNGVDGRIV